MKLFAILAIVATVVLPVLPSSAAVPVSCSGDASTTNNQSSLSSTSAGGQTCTVGEEVALDYLP